MQKIVIIGAGIGGLYTALAFDESLNKEKYTFIIYERQANIGGLWNFVEDVEIDSSDGLPVHSAMYKNLMTNTTTELVELNFTNLFNEDEQKYVSRKRYLDALIDLAKKYDLNKYIKCCHYVNKVKRCDKGFVLDVINLENHTSFSEECDFVIVAAGRYSIPKWPQAEREYLKNFSGEYIHSKDIKDTARYSEKRVLCIGSGFSALDIALHLHKAGAPLVTVATKPRLVMANCKYEWNDHFNAVISPIKSVDGFKVTFENGICAEFDVVIACTGYLCEFPFIAQDLQPNNFNSVFPHLYEVIFNANYPKLMFVGALYALLPKHLSYLQGHYISHILNNNMETLPNKEQMEKAIQHMYEELPNDTTMESLLKFHYKYYYRLQTASPRKVLDKRYERLLKYNFERLFTGRHLEEMNKGLNDFDYA